MSTTKSKPSSTAALTTSTMPFRYQTTADTSGFLYRVQPGISSAYALSEASCLLSSAIGILNQQEDNDEAYGVVALLEMAQGLVNAVNARQE